MSKIALSKTTYAMFVLAILTIIAVLVVTGLQLTRSSTAPVASSTVEKSDVALQPAPIEVKETLEDKKPVDAVTQPKVEVSPVVNQKIDASTDKTMVDSLDFISRQMDAAGQQQLQDDYNAIQTALESQAAADDLKDVDSLAAVRKAVDGKTAAELSVIAEQFKPKS